MTMETRRESKNVWGYNRLQLYAGTEDGKRPRLLVPAASQGLDSEEEC